jgi:excisionase family DNA binding protein
LKVEKQTYRIEEAAQILGISRQTAYVLARNGELPGGRKLGGRLIISKIELDAYLNPSKFKTVKE